MRGNLVLVDATFELLDAAVGDLERLATLLRAHQHITCKACHKDLKDKAIVAKKTKAMAIYRAEMGMDDE
jgi:hypothetical protein